MATWRQVSAKTAIVMALDSSFYRRYLRLGRIDEAVMNLPMTKEQVLFVEDASHMLHLEQPLSVAKLIERFFS